MNGKTCLFHATLAKNVASILKDGLLTPWERARRQNIPVKDIPLNADTSNIYAIYLGKKDGLNYPFEIQSEPLAMLQVCFSPDETSKFLPDDDYVEDFVLTKRSEAWYHDKWSRWRKTARDDYVRKFWKKSIDDGYGIRHEGSITPDHVAGCEIGEFMDRKFVAISKCPGFEKTP
jgi:hypothetical protein